MIKLSDKQASIYAGLVFILTIVFSFFLQVYTVTLSGLLVVIFLSVFVHTKSSTLIAGLISTAVVIALTLWNVHHFGTVILWTEFLFMLILILFTTLIVFYIKTLMQHMQLDKSHMTSLFENATEGILVTNNRGTIVLANPAALKIFEYTEDELIGQSIEVLLPKSYRTGHVQLRDGFYHHPQNRVMGSGRDLYGERKGGINFPVEVSLSSYKQANNQYVIAFIVDITHRKEIEKSILQQQEQLEKVTKEIRNMNVELEGKVEERTIILKEALQRLEQSQEFFQLFVVEAF